MRKQLDLSASEALILEAANYAVHAGWLDLQQNWHGDLYPEPADDFHRNIHPRVLKMSISVEDIEVVPMDWSGGPNAPDPDYWGIIQDNALQGRGTGSQKCILVRKATASVTLTADHRANPVSMQLAIVVEGSADNPDLKYRGHWYAWQVEGEMLEIETGRTRKIWVTNTCLADHNSQRINGQLVLGHKAGIPYFTQEQPGLNS